jgi:hypothetical protein
MAVSGQETHDKIVERFVKGAQHIAWREHCTPADALLDIWNANRDVPGMADLIREAMGRVPPPGRAPERVPMQPRERLNADG